MAEPTRMRIAGATAKAMPRKVGLTKSAVDALACPPGRADVHLYDAKVAGLAYRVTARGARAWYLVRRIKGRPQRVRLGGGDLTVEQARRAAEKMNGEIAGGSDPATERRTVRRSATLGELWTAYHDRHLKPRGTARTIETDSSRWDTCFEGWANRRSLAVTEADVRALHADLGKTRGHVTANRAVQLLRRMYNWARLGHNPAGSGAVSMFRETSRSRFVQPGELPALFKALDAEETNPTIRDFLYVALLTGARRANVCAMRDEEVDVAAAKWTIPGTKSKNHEPMTVPLSPEAVAIIAPRLGHPSGYVFPGDGRTGHLVEPKATWAAVLKRSGLSDLRLHDLRRTLGSWQAAGGSSLPVIGASLGHRNAATTAIYARLNLDPVRASVVNATDAMLAAGRPDTKAKPKRRGKRKPKPDGGAGKQ